MKLKFDNGYDPTRYMDGHAEFLLPIEADAHRPFRRINPGTHFYPSFSQPIFLPVKEIQVVDVDGYDIGNTFLGFQGRNVRFYASHAPDAGIIFQACMPSRHRSFVPITMENLTGGESSPIHSGSRTYVRYSDIIHKSWFLGWANRDTLFASDWVHHRQYKQTCLAILKQVWVAFGRALPAYADTSDPPIKFYFGADPEFELVKNGWVQDGCDVFTGYRYGPIGLDAAGSQLELRPQPCSDPKELYRRIRMLAVTAEERLEHQISLAGLRYPLGCHIHIGPADGEGYVSMDRQCELVDQIDEAVGWLVELSGVGRGSYRSRCEAESKRSSHGGFEYRTLPSCVLVSEKLFVAVVEAIRAAIFEQPIPKIPDDEVQKVTALVKKGVHFTFDYEILVPRFAYYGNHIFSAEFKQAIRERTEDMATHCRVLSSNYTLVGYQESRGLVTNVDVLAKKLGWTYLETPFPWSEYGLRSRQIALPYHIRVCASGTELDDFIDDLFTVLDTIGCFTSI